MNVRAAQLTLRLNRFELRAFGVLLVAASVAGVVVAAHLHGLAPPPVCFEPYVNEPLPECRSADEAFYGAQSLAQPLYALLVFLPLATGAFMGVPIVARELERGTTRLAWSLGSSRWRWYLARLLPILLAVGLLTFAAGVAADHLTGAFRPNVDMSKAFDSFGFRGLLLASRSVFVFAIAVAVGSIVGRVLPAVIVATVIAGIGLVGGEQVHQKMLQSEAVIVDQGAVVPGDLYVDQGFRLPDGRIVGWEYFDGGNASEAENPYNEDGTSRYPEVAMIVPGERYREAETREALVLAGGSLVTLLAGGVVVGRRRPG